MSFTRQTAADCPKCGCNCCIPQPTRDEEPGVQRYECDHCGHEFKVEVQPVSRVVKYLEKRIPICPVHNVPMHNNGRPVTVSTRGERSVYYKCPCPGCVITSKGTERKV